MKKYMLNVEELVELTSEERSSLNAKPWGARTDFQPFSGYDGFKTFRTVNVELTLEEYNKVRHAVLATHTTLKDN